MKALAKDPAAAKKQLDANHPGTVPRFVISAVIGRTQVKTDALPHYPNNYLTNHDVKKNPMAMYLEEKSNLRTIRQNAMDKGKADDEQYKTRIREGITKLYGLRQIMAEAEDPTADAPDLDARLNEKTAALDGDEGFRNAIKMCEYSTAYTKRILDHFDDPGFGSLTDKLNRDSDGFFRYVVREDNKKILAENQKLTDNKEKELLQPQV